MIGATQATAMAAWLNEAGVGPLVLLAMTLGGVEVAVAWFERAARLGEPV